MIRNILYYYKKNVDGTDFINHCEGINETQHNELTPLYASDSNRYAQFPHAISIKGHSGLEIVIAENSFSNLMLPGALIYLNEMEESYSSKLVMSGNRFNYIVPYMNVGILDLRRALDQNKIPY